MNPLPKSVDHSLHKVRSGGWLQRSAFFKLLFKHILKICFSDF